MWPLLAADLKARSRLLLTGSLGCLGAWVGLELVTQGPVRWAGWFATAMVMLPVFSALHHAGVEGRERRACLLETLPIDRIELALVRFAAPLAVQLLGGVLAAAALGAVRIITGGAAGQGGRVLVMTTALAALAQWILMQVEILSGRQGRLPGGPVLLSAASALGAMGAFVLLLGGLIRLLPGLGVGPALVTAGAVMTLVLLQVNVHLHARSGEWAR